MFLIGPKVTESMEKFRGFAAVSKKKLVRYLNGYWIPWVSRLATPQTIPLENKFLFGLEKFPQQNSPPWVVRPNRRNEIRPANKYAAQKTRSHTRWRDSVYFGRPPVA